MVIQEQLLPKNRQTKSVTNESPRYEKNEQKTLKWTKELTLPLEAGQCASEFLLKLSNPLVLYIGLSLIVLEVILKLSHGLLDAGQQLRPHELNPFFRCSVVQLDVLTVLWRDIALKVRDHPVPVRLDGHGQCNSSVVTLLGGDDEFVFAQLPQNLMHVGGIPPIQPRKAAVGHDTRRTFF